MALDEADIQALQLLIREEIRSEIAPFRGEMATFRDDTQSNFDALFKADEDRKQEYLVLGEQTDCIE